MDINLGSGITGITAAKNILKIRDIPIIFLSSNVEPEIIKQTEKITNYGFIVKTTGETMIISSIKMAFKLFETKQNEQKKIIELEEINNRYYSLVKKTESKLRERVNEISSIYHLSDDMQKDISIKQLCKKIIENLSKSFQYPNITVPVIKINDDIYFNDKYEDNLSHYIESPINTYINNNTISGYLRVYYSENKNFLIPEEQNLINSVANLLSSWIKQRLLENELKLSYSRIYKVLNNINVMILIIDLTNYDVLFVNNYAKKELGDVEGKKCWELFYKNQKGTCNFCSNKLLLQNKNNNKFIKWEYYNEINKKWYEFCDRIIDWVDKPLVKMHVAFDITERKYNTEKIIQSEIKFKQLFENTPDAILVADAETGNIVDANLKAQHLTGYSLKELKNMHQSKLHPIEMQESSKKEFKKVINYAPGEYMKEHLILNAQGKCIPVEIIAGGNFKYNNKLLHIGVFRDITEQKNTLNKINNLLKEKTILLKETHHRIKNNMHVMQSILSIEAMNCEDITSKTILEDCSKRMISMKIIYENLYQKEITETMSLKFYIKQLITNLLEIYKSVKNIQSELNIEDIYLKPEIVSPIGIILNELVTNTFKHAFPEQKTCTINISATKNENLITLIYADNVSGLPDSVNFENSSSFGLQLIAMLVEQIKGNIITERKNGTKYIITFSN